MTNIYYSIPIKQAISAIDAADIYVIYSDSCKINFLTTNILILKLAMNDAYCFNN